MKSSLGILAAASIPLLLNAPRASAGEVQFNAPATERAQQSRELLGRAAYALNTEVSARVRGDRDERLSNLWIYPTKDADTVFAHYTLTANHRSLAGDLSSTQHLAVVTVRDNRVVALEDLNAAAVGDSDNWWAKIGNGHTSNSSPVEPKVSQGTPASAHWSASIGTGQAANAVNEAQRGPAKLAGAAVSTPTAVHWTSKIGTAHASESDAETTKRRI